jgi:putative transposase
METRRSLEYGLHARCAYRWSALPDAQHPGSGHPRVRECLALEVDTSLPAQRVTRVLDQLVAYYGAPQQITVDNGPEFAGRILDAWAYTHGVILDFIEPGKPTQNAHIESFNGKFRDECLDRHWFGSLAHARAVIHAWKEEYNTERPHSALRQQTPAAFAQSLAI